MGCCKPKGSILLKEGEGRRDAAVSISTAELQAVQFGFLRLSWRATNCPIKILFSNFIFLRRQTQLVNSGIKSPTS